MASKNSNSTSDDGPFRFMDLPREIRDAIYDELIVDVAFTSKILCQSFKSSYVSSVKTSDDLDKFAPFPYPDREASFTLRNAPVASSFTVSHQFNREYQESLVRNNLTSTLRMTDRNDAHLRTPMVPKSEILRNIHNLEIQLVAECNDYITYDFQPTHLSHCRCWNQIRAHVHRISKDYAALISAIGSCQLLLCIRGPKMMGEESAAGLENTLGPLTGMAETRNVEVLHFPDHVTGDHRDVLHCYKPISGPYASWSSEEGWTHHEVEAVPWRQMAKGKGVLRERPIWEDERSE